MEIKIPVQELSDGRFRNALTGKIGDSVRNVVFKDTVAKPVPAGKKGDK